MLVLKSMMGLLGVASMAMAASLQQVTSFGNNPTGVQMYIYVPDKVAANPMIIVGLHPCGGSAQEWYSATKLPSYADNQGFIIIYAGTIKNSNCWDIQNPGSLTHGGSGDALGIVSMVNYALTKYNGNPAKVYVFGGSSGAMMTNVMAGSYPDVFEAGAVFSGVAFACAFGSVSSTPTGSNQTCAQGLQHTPAEWANFVHNAYPSYTGKHTRMQIWHGGADTLVRPQCAIEQTKQWSQVQGISSSGSVANNPSSGWTQQNWGDGSKLVLYTNPSVGHFAPVNEVVMLAFFALGGGGSTVSTTTSTTMMTTTSIKTSTTTAAPVTTTSTKPTTTSTTTAAPGGCTSKLYDQCAGVYFKGCTTCASGTTCHYVNDYYSQCL